MIFIAATLGSPNFSHVDGVNRREKKIELSNSNQTKPIEQTVASARQPARHNIICIENHSRKNGLGYGLTPPIPLYSTLFSSLFDFMFFCYFLF